MKVVTHSEYESDYALLQDQSTSHGKSCYMTIVRVKEKLLHK